MVKETRIPVQGILDNAEDCTPEEIVGPDINPSVWVHVMRRVLRFARLAEAASLLQQAETIKHPLWEDESDRGELAPDVLNLLQQTASEIERAAGNTGTGYLSARRGRTLAARYGVAVILPATRPCAQRPPEALRRGAKNPRETGC